MALNRPMVIGEYLFSASCMGMSVEIGKCITLMTIIVLGKMKIL